MENNVMTEKQLKAIRRSKANQMVKQIIAHLIIFFLLFFVFLPLYLLLTKSFKTPEQETDNPFGLTFPFCWDNYTLAWEFVKNYILNIILMGGINDEMFM